MSGLTSVLSPFSRHGLPTLPLLLLLVYAVASATLGGSIRHLENQARQTIELRYAASTLEKDLVSLTRDAQAMVSAPSPLRMQALLINLEEYANALDAMSALSVRRSELQAPLNALEDALPGIRSVVLQAARLDADRTDALVQEQAGALTRIDGEMNALVSDIDNQISASTGVSGVLADRLRLLNWILNILAVGLVVALIFGALRQGLPQSVKAPLAD